MAFNAVAIALLMFFNHLEKFDIDQHSQQQSLSPNDVNYKVNKVECAAGTYPPPTGRNISEYVINLDLPPQQRWAALAPIYSSKINELLDLVKNLTRPIFHNLIVELVDKYVPKLVDTLPYPFADEIKGIAQATGMEIGEVGLYNIFYEIFTVCTSIVAQSEGRLYHARNMDFGIFLGWDKKTKSWRGTEVLRELTVLLDYQKDGQTVFKSVNFVGYVGVATAIKPGKFSLTVDERFNFIGGYIGILKWLMGKRSGSWTGLLTRSVMENANSFEDAKKTLSESELLAPIYFILGGSQPGQAAVITRGLKFVDVWDIGANGSSNWYLVETNYDHWKKPPSFDDRRTPAKTCMDNLGQKNLSFGGIFDVLSTVPVLNKLTVYTSLMEVASGNMENYLQYCETDDCPFI